MTYLVVGLLIFLSCGGVGAALAGEKGRGLAGFWLGFFFGPIGIVIALLIAPAETPNATDKSITLKPCPYCAELIQPAAVKCRYCQSELPESFRTEASSVAETIITVTPTTTTLSPEGPGDADQTGGNTKFLFGISVAAVLSISVGIIVSAVNSSTQKAAPVSSYSPPYSSPPLEFPAPDDPRAKAILRACIDGKPYALVKSKWVPNNIVIGDAPPRCVVQK